jgi:hypothetical protein
MDIDSFVQPKQYWFRAFCFSALVVSIVYSVACSHYASVYVTRKLMHCSKSPLLSDVPKFNLLSLPLSFSEIISFLGGKLPILS